MKMSKVLGYFEGKGGAFLHQFRGGLMAGRNILWALDLRPQVKLKANT
ncbi:hypothetical protein K3759_01550 [Sulfitobacter sp. W027]|jgi:hypothetical protein|nr:hypothetical protein [Sulfitobacter sp. W027]UWR33807.1 hypothetical protein K3759_01550 [Sulfitobacter sp. W027]|tara:strand:+ start:179 stop:322 length:144 start_codon:yes stop_codon:yes gene_type:complete